MDGSAARQPKPKSSWAFMTEHMPRVVAQIRDQRTQGNGPHVDLCWRRGVVELQPDWFWAYEGGVAVGVLGTAMAADAAVQQVLRDFPGGHILMLRTVERVADGTQ